LAQDFPLRIKPIVEIKAILKPTGLIPFECAFCNQDMKIVAEPNLWLP